MKPLLFSVTFACFGIAVVGAQTPASAPPQPPPGHVAAWETAAGGHQQFDVISIRENKDSEAQSSVNVPYGADDNYRNTGGVFSATNWPVASLIAFAYKNSTSQRDAFRASLPDWTKTVGFNIEAKTDNHDVTKDQIRLMVRSMLEERFGLKAHYESREAPVYAVELAKPGVLGPGLRPHPADDPCSGVVPRAPQQSETDVQSVPANAPPPPTTVAGGFPVRCGSFVNMPPSELYFRHEGGRNITMAQITSTFTGMGNLGRPVVDKTGLTGTYDWVMEFIDERPGRNPPPDAEGPNFEEALRKQCGLKLVSEKAPFDFFIVDHIERPSEN